MIIISYARSSFRDFDSYLRDMIDLDGRDIQLGLKRYTSHFTTYDLPTGIYRSKDRGSLLHRRS